MQRPAIVPVGIAYSAAISACKMSQQHRQGLTSLTCDAAPGHRARCVHLQCCHQRARRRQQHQHTLHLLRARQRHAIVPEVFAYSAAFGACGRCQQHQQALTCLRAMRRHVIAPDVFAYSDALSACEKCQQRQQVLHL